MVFFYRANTKFYAFLSRNKGVEHLKYPNAYLSYLVEFHGSRDYFECHEILEEFWKEVDPRNRTSHWVGLIQIAVSMYHYRRGNLIGATRTIKKAEAILSKHLTELTSLGVDAQKLLLLLNETARNIMNNQPYKSISFPFSDHNLSNQCKIICEKMGYNWLNTGPFDEQIIHKHLLRDRTDIIKERQQQLHTRREKR